MPPFLHLCRRGEEGIEEALAAEPQRRSTAWLSPLESLHADHTCDPGYIARGVTLGQKATLSHQCLHGDCMNWQQRSTAANHLSMVGIDGQSLSHLVKSFYRQPDALGAMRPERAIRA